MADPQRPTTLPDRVCVCGYSFLSGTHLCTKCGRRGAPLPEAQTLADELASVLNRHSTENASNAPDFILAQYLLGCLAAWNTAVQQRENWYGRDPRPTSTEPINGE